jgi:hypothetical protein
MADLKISALTSATTPLGGTEVLPVVQSATTKKTAVSTIKDYILGLANTFTANQTIQTTASTASKMTVVSELDGSSDYQSNFEVRRSGTAGGARWKSKRSPSLGGVGWVAQVTVDNAAEVAATYTDAFAIDNTGNATVSTGNLVIGTSGKGIDFSATAGTGTSELLADYEEGTWTATDQSGASLVLTSTYCRYTKVGNLVTVSGFISYPVTADASAAIIGGLPFTASATQQSAINVWNSAALNLYGYIDASTQRIIFRDNTNTGVTNVSLSNKFVCFTAAYTV